MEAPIAAVDIFRTYIEFLVENFNGFRRYSFCSSPPAGMDNAKNFVFWRIKNYGNAIRK